ncbi:MAG TPA: hypothetical protein PKO42_06835, partial [Tenuifilaceae bacterium]|nr:hypothetical protein [Tenuifilaceae bacterium]
MSHHGVNLVQVFATLSYSLNSNSKRFCKFCLPYSRWTCKNERANWFVWVMKSCSTTLNRTCNNI